MTDIFISHARDNRDACERLAEALTSVGLSVGWDKAFDQQSHFANQIEKSIQAASATIVLWSKGALVSDWVRPEALRAFGLRSKGGADGANRYAGLILDQTEPQHLPIPFNGLDTTSWAQWFAASEIDFDDSNFIALLARLEVLTGRANLSATAIALAKRDDMIAQTKADKAAVDDRLSELLVTLSTRDRDAKAAADRLGSLEQDLTAARDASAKLVASHDAKLAELEARYVELGKARNESVERAALLASRLSENEVSLVAVRTELESAREKISAVETAQQATMRDLEDARTGLTGALRQHKTLQAQIDAGDQIIREVMTQREGLIAAREKLERDSEKISIQLADTSRRLTEAEARRATYETALVERTKEIRVLEEKVSAFDVELGELKPRAVALAETVKTWGHVPWRGIAAGGLAAGALVTYGAAIGGQALDAWLKPAGNAIALSQPASQLPQPAESSPAKTDAKVDPDSLLADGGAPERFDINEPASVDDGVIPIPSESDVPVSTDQVQFNPEGLPPADLDSRPPPQDLPPMQQKPKLLLKPPVPPVQ